MSLLSLKYSSVLQTTHIFHQWISYFTAFSNMYFEDPNAKNYKKATQEATVKLQTALGSCF